MDLNNNYSFEYNEIDLVVIMCNSLISITFFGKINKVIKLALMYCNEAVHEAINRPYQFNVTRGPPV